MGIAGFGIVGMASPAAAQFVCAGSVDGSAPTNGAGATADGNITPTNTACGYRADATGLASSNSAFGSNANASGDLGSSNIAVGAGANASGDTQSNVAIGSNAYARAGANIGNVATGNVAVGANAAAGGTQANGLTNHEDTALGTNANAGTAAGDDRATAAGSDAVARLDGSAFGVGSDASVQGTAIGSAAKAFATNGTALGYNAQATNANDVALGQSSVTGFANSTAGNAANGVSFNSGTSNGVVSVGEAGAERQIQNVAAGAVTVTSTDAVNGSQLYGVAKQTQANTSNINALGTAAAAAFGGGAGYNPNTNVFTPPTYTLNNGTQTYNDVGDALTNLDGRTTGNTNAIAALTTSVSSGTFGPVQRTGTTNQLALVAPGGTGATPGAAQILTNVAAGTLGATSTQAVNGSQLYATNQQVAALEAGTAGPFEANNTNGRAAPVVAGTDASAGGFGASATGNQSTALGNNATAAGPAATAVGFGAQANGANSTVVGTSDIVTGTASGAFGTGNTVAGNGSYAVGDPNTVTGNNSFVFGDNNAITASNGIAIGTGNNVAQAGAVAIGNGVTTTRANQVAIGNAGNTYTMAGITSAASLAAQTGPTAVVTSDAAGNLATTNNVATATSVASLDGRVNGLQNNVAVLQNNVAQLQTDVRKGYEGTAVAIALGGSTFLPDGKRYAVSANFGTFRDQTAFGGSFLFRVTDNIVLNAGVGGGFQYGGIGARGGATYAW